MENRIDFEEKVINTITIWNESYVERSKMEVLGECKNSVLSTKVCSKRFTWGRRQAIPQLYLFQLPGEHYRGAVITNDTSLWNTAYSRDLVLHMSGVRKCK